MDIGHKLQINDSVCPYLFSMWIDDPLILKLTASNVLWSLTSQKLKLKDKKEQLVYKWIISCTLDTFYDPATWHVKSFVSLLLHVNASFHWSNSEQNCGFYVLGSRPFSKSFISDKNTSDIKLTKNIKDGKWLYLFPNNRVYFIREEKEQRQGPS